MVYMVYMVVRAKFQACVSFFPTVFISVWQKDVNLEFSPVSSPSVLLVRMPSENKPPTSGPSHAPTCCLSHKTSNLVLQLCNSSLTAMAFLASLATPPWLHFFKDKSNRIICCFPTLWVKGKKKVWGKLLLLSISLFIDVFFFYICSKKMASDSSALLSMHSVYSFLQWHSHTQKKKLVFHENVTFIEGKYNCPGSKRCPILLKCIILSKLCLTDCHRNTR